MRNPDIVKLNTIVLDLNGTLAVKGKIVAGVEERINRLQKNGFRIVLITADQRGNATQMAKSMGIEVKIGKNGKEKARLMKEFKKASTVAIGNARIDIGTFKNASLAIATMQAEGIHAGIIQYVDIIVPSINDALDLLLDTNSISATLRQ